MRIPSTDHLGNEFPSIIAMYEHWGIPYYVYMQRDRAAVVFFTRV